MRDLNAKIMTEVLHAKISTNVKSMKTRDTNRIFNIEIAKNLRVIQDAYNNIGNYGWCL